MSYSSPNPTKLYSNSTKLHIEYIPHRSTITDWVPHRLSSQKLSSLHTIPESQAMKEIHMSITQQQQNKKNQNNLYPPNTTIPIEEFYKENILEETQDTAPHSLSPSQQYSVPSKFLNAFVCTRSLTSSIVTYLTQVLDLPDS